MAGIGIDHFLGQKIDLTKNQTRLTQEHLARIGQCDAFVAS